MQNFFKKNYSEIFVKYITLVKYNLFCDYYLNEVAIMKSYFKISAAAAASAYRQISHHTIRHHML
jgi:hypothetical protein